MAYELSSHISRLVHNRRRCLGQLAYLERRRLRWWWLFVYFIRAARERMARVKHNWIEL